MEERVFFEIKHVFQEDIGFKKCKILNESIKISGERIVIIDGDCLLYHKFLENYSKYFDKGYEVLFGKRCEMSKALNEKLLKEKRCKVNLLELVFSKSKHWRECIYFPIIYKINGFNEEFESPGVGEDSDLEWRFKKVGAKYISLKYILIEYHLWHKESGTHNTNKNYKIMEKNIKENNWYTKRGIF